MNPSPDMAKASGKRMTTLGILLCIKLFLVGLIMVTGGSAVRSTAEE